MTDRELLEAAAKAAGIDVPAKESPWSGICSSGFSGAWWDVSGGGDGTKFRQWSPLTDDGDALRLAVKLGISTTHEPRQGLVYADVVETRIAAEQLYGDDSYAATRRAIVRAAAAIGGAK